MLPLHLFTYSELILLAVVLQPLGQCTKWCWGKLALQIPLPETMGHG